MFTQSIALFKARNDSSLAKEIASEMIVDGVVDRASWPIVIAKFWMSLGLGILAILICLFLWLGHVTHWSLAVPIFPFGGLAYLILRVWRGINKGIEKVTDLAKAQILKTVTPAK